MPKGTELSVYSQVKLNAVARRLNKRPRKTQNHETPAERLQHRLYLPSSADGQSHFGPLPEVREFREWNDKREPCQIRPLLAAIANP
jgi:hypothetical protein